MSKTVDVMIDLETTGTSAGCGILSLGACTFDGAMEFYDKIAPESNTKWGLKEDPDTIGWWYKQSPEARLEAFSGVKDLVEVLGGFADFLLAISRSNGGADVFIWGNGADFDLPILGAGYKATGMRQPWKPFNGRCYRTLKNLYFDIKAEKFEGMKHNALADAKFQATHAMAILRERKRINELAYGATVADPAMVPYPNRNS